MAVRSGVAFWSGVGIGAAAVGLLAGGWMLLASDTRVLDGEVVEVNLDDGWLRLQPVGEPFSQAEYTVFLGPAWRATGGAWTHAWPPCARRGDVIRVGVTQRQASAYGNPETLGATWMECFSD